MSTSPELAVRIVHPTPIIARGIAAILADEADISVTRPAAGASAMPDRSDVVICDYDTALALLRAPRAGDPARVLVVTEFDREVQVRVALQAGARGYLLTGGSADEMVAAVRSVGRGGFFVSRTVAPLVASTLASDPLTGRESDVLRLLVDGMGNKQIAVRLAITVGTVKSHVGAILEKLGASTRTEAAAVANRRGLVVGLTACGAIRAERLSGPLRTW